MWSLIVTQYLLPEARVGGHGYSSLLVCLFVVISVSVSLIMLTISPHEVLQ